jgi:hypothetical protein
LWDLGKELENSSANWWILKPGMADRGMGIRLFNSKDALRQIFEDFDSYSEDDEESSTGVVTSQLRHFVIQVTLTAVASHNLIQVRVNRNMCPIRYSSIQGRFKGRDSRTQMSQTYVATKSAPGFSSVIRNKHSMIVSPACLLRLIKRSDSLHLVSCAGFVFSSPIFSAGRGRNRRNRRLDTSFNQYFPSDAQGRTRCSATRRVDWWSHSLSLPISGR